MSPAGLKRLQARGPAMVEAAVRTAAAPDAQGWVQVTIPIESAEHAALELLCLGAEGEALEPLQLREMLTATTERLAALYLRPAKNARRTARRR